MFEVEYCDDPNNVELNSADIKYDLKFADEFDKKLTCLDKCMFLVDMYTIIESCGAELLSICIVEDEFWKINKCLLNFVNAIYAYKEYLSNYEPSLESITSKYYNKKTWYRFICDFRNYIIHQSLIIKEYRPFDGEIFVNIEEIKESLIKYEYTKEWQKRKADDFVKWIETFKPDASIIEEKHFYSMKKITTLVLKEIKQMKKEILSYIYRKSIKSTVEWLIEKIIKVEGVFKYTFIVDKISQSVYEPNYALENFVKRMYKTLGEEFGLCQELKIQLNCKGYLSFYDEKG